MIRASAPYTSGWGSFVLLKIDCVRVARGGSLSTLHRHWTFQILLYVYQKTLIGITLLRPLNIVSMKRKATICQLSELNFALNIPNILTRWILHLKRARFWSFALISSYVSATFTVLVPCVRPWDSVAWCVQCVHRSGTLGQTTHVCEANISHLAVCKEFHSISSICETSQSFSWRNHEVVIWLLLFSVSSHFKLIFWTVKRVSTSLLRAMNNFLLPKTLYHLIRESLKLN